MPEDRTITEAVRRVSALAGHEVEVSILAGGYTNSVFLVRAGDERYVFRVPGQSSDVLEINRADERYNAEMAARSGVAPDVVDYVEGLDVMVLTFIDGQAPTSEDLQTSDQVRRIAAAVRALHGGPRFNNDALCSRGPNGGWQPATRSQSRFPATSRAAWESSTPSLMH